MFRAFQISLLVWLALPALAQSVILLGTKGGPTPGRFRAAPATAILQGDDVNLVDCGNGVAGQMARAGLALPRLRRIFITHHHSDHNADLGTVLLLAWASGLKRPVDVYGPAPLKAMVDAAFLQHEADIAIRMKDEGRVDPRSLVRVHEVGAGDVLTEGGIQVRAAEVVHPPLSSALAYRFDLDGRSIVVSGDTTYAPGLADLAKGADLLLHEVMYLPALERLIAQDPSATRLREHLRASHATAAQAASIAAQAGVKTLVLTHFVPGDDPAIRPKDWLRGVRPRFKGKVVLGRDLMVLC